MAGTQRTRGRKSLILISIILGIVLVVVGGYFFAKSSTNKAKIETATTVTQSAKSTTDTGASDSKSTSASTPAVDPSTLNTVDVQPLGITVSYTKGTPGFEFDIQKTADRTQYVEFTSSDLVGTKCTDDQGIFATIVKNPSSSEDQSTLTATTKVGNDTYGLSLSSADCTSNPDLLSTYQTSFKNGFSSLKAISQ